jgi:hypothetical protein
VSPRPGRRYYGAPGVLMGRMATGKIATLALAIALAVPAPAGAARVVVPPGNSEADQYYETVPSPSGPRAPDTTKLPRDAVRDGALAEGTEAALRERGPGGLALVTAVAQTAEGRAGGAGTPSDRVVGALGDPGMGAGFPLLLVAAAAAAAAFFVARRRGLVSR